MSKKARLLYARTDVDDVLKAVLAEIHKSAQLPDPGFLTRSQWSVKWRISPAMVDRYVRIAIKGGVLVERSFRVITKGRMRLMRHFGPPPPQRRSAKPT